MRTKLFALVIASVVVLAQAAPAAAQNRNARGDWSAVEALSPGEKIVVRTKDGDRLAGRFDSATDLAINFMRDGKKVSLTRESVRRVQISRGKSRWKGALVGAGIGGGLGVGAGGYLVARDSNFGSTALVGFSLLGAGVGAGLGAAIGLGTNYDTVYDAP